MKFTVVSMPGQQQAQQVPNQPQESQQQPQGIGQQLSNSPIGSLVRSGVGLASDIGADIAGTPGNIASLGLGFGNWLSGGAIPTYQQIQEKLPISIPTGEDIKGAISKATGGYTEPQSGTESTIRDVLGTAASLALPSRLAGKAGAGLSKLLSPEKATKVGKAAEKVFLPFSGLEVSPTRALALATAGEVGAKGSEALGGGPVEQALSKILFMGAANTAGTRQKLNKAMGDYFDKAENAVKSNIIQTTGERANAVSVKGVDQIVNTLEHELATSASPYKENMAHVLSKFKQAESNASPTGKLAGAREHAVFKADDLMRLDKDLNQFLQLHETPHFEGQPYLPKATATEVKRLQTKVRDGLAHIAEHNPEFKANYYPAKDIASGLFNTYSLGKFFKNNANIDDILTSKLSKLAFTGAGAYTLASHPGLAIGGAAVAKGGAELMKLAKLLKVPAARKAYQDAFKAAVKNDIRDFVVHASKFDKYAQMVK